MSFGAEFLEELRARIPIENLIGRRIKLTKRGREYVGLSPFNQEKTPSFTVVPDKGFYHCFSSGEHGDIIAWVMKIEGLSFQESVEKLAAEANLPLPKVALGQAGKAVRQTRLYEVLEETAKWYQDQLASGIGKEARDYLFSRGVSKEAVSRFRLGFAPHERKGLVQALTSQGFSEKDLIEAGVLKAGDGGRASRPYFFNRVVFPIRDRRGRIMAFGGRALDHNSPAKYLNSPETSIFHKGRVVYNLDLARLHAYKGADIIVVEGYMDVIALSEAGFQAAVAPLGTAISEQQIMELWRLVDEPIICLDGDRAGRQAGVRIMARILPYLQPGKSLRFAFMPDGEDPDSLLRTRGGGAMREILATLQPLSDFLWNTEASAAPATTPEQKAGLKQRLLRQLDSIRDSNVRESYRVDMLERFRRHFTGSQRQAFSFAGVSKRSGNPSGGPSLAQSTSTQGIKQALTALKQRAEQIFLATLINHPDILSLRAEEIAAVTLQSREMDYLRQTLLDWVGFAERLDREGLTCHLSSLGFAGALTLLRGPTIYQHALSARAEADFKDALRLVDELLERFQDREKRDLPKLRVSREL